MDETSCAAGLRTQNTQAKSTTLKISHISVSAEIFLSQSVSSVDMTEVTKCRILQITTSDTLSDLDPSKQKKKLCWFSKVISVKTWFLLLLRWIEPDMEYSSFQLTLCREKQTNKTFNLILI